MGIYGNKYLIKECIFGYSGDILLHHVGKILKQNGHLSIELPILG